MSPIRLVGLFITLLGFVAGGILVAEPFVPAIEASALALALLFPACLAVGLPLFALSGERSAALNLCGWGLVILGLGALLGIFVDILGLYPASSTLLLWLLAPVTLFSGLLLTYFAGAVDRLQAEGHEQGH